MLLLAGRHFRLGSMLSRDAVTSRLATPGAGMSVTEFSFLFSRRSTWVGPTDGAIWWLAANLSRKLGTIVLVMLLVVFPMIVCAQTLVLLFASPCHR